MTEPTHRTVSLAGATWAVRGGRSGWEAMRPGYGVQEIASGRFLSRGGVQPGCWRRQADAAVIAQYPPAWRTVAVQLPS